MSRASINSFKGVDRRRQLGMADPKTAYIADNLYLGSGGVWKTRPGSKAVYALPPTSAGLYTGAGALRVAAPAGDASIAVYQRPQLWIDYIEGADAIEEVLGAELYGVLSSAAGAQPYLAVRRSTGAIEHHWCQQRPAAPGDPVSSRVRTGFVPSGGIVKLSRKIMAPSNTTGRVHFSSTENGPGDWTAEQDAGNIPAQQHSTGDLQMTALGYRENRLVVFFESQIQVWAVDPQPDNFFLVEILNGPGTLDPGLVENVLGDLFFFSRGGFRSLSTQLINDELREGDIGAPVFELTEALTGRGKHAVWWQRLGCYLSAFDDGQVFCYKYDPMNKTFGWSVWTFPFVVERFAILDNQLYARSGDTAYLIDDSLETDDGADIDWAWRSAFMGLGAPDVLKSLQSVLLNQRGTSSLSLYTDPGAPTFAIPGTTTEGVTPPWAKIPLTGLCSSFALGLTGKGLWQLDGLTLHYSLLGV